MKLFIALLRWLKRIVNDARGLERAENERKYEL